jgi:hypothetical protein
MFDYNFFIEQSTAGRSSRRLFPTIGMACFLHVDNVYDMYE